MTGTDTPAPFNVFEYRYRDAGNFKTHGMLLLTGYAPEAGHDA